jgi:Hydrogenase maturation factor
MAQGMIDRGLNTPRTSSMGRLFDTVSALCGFVGSMSFEGQAAMELEALAWHDNIAPSFGTDGLLHHDDARWALDHGYPLPHRGGVWDPNGLLRPLLEDLQDGALAARVALRFHAGLANAVRDAALVHAARMRVDAVALSGGVWQNRLLHELTVRALRDAGFDVWWNRTVPLGDGGIALGQAALAAAHGSEGGPYERA